MRVISKILLENIPPAFIQGRKGSLPKGQADDI
jgi:hypothetical protein